MASKNIEIKAHCQDPDKIKSILEEHDTVYKGLDHQIDTYFNTDNGRLKLREGTIENNLIHYHRSNQAGPKQSSFNLYPSKDPTQLKAILTESYGIKVIVDKQRHIYFINNVKFHVDEVKGLGSFMEIEVTDLKDELDLKDMQSDCDRFMKLLQIDQKDLITNSYSDLILDKT